MTGQFSPAFREELAALMRWRRDVRRFRTDPVPEDSLARALHAFTLAPSVGLSEPWRLLRIDSASARAACLANFSDCNARALNGFDGDRAATYSRLKLSGMAEAPVHLAAFCDDSTPKGHGLGAATMPETRAWSVVGAITHLWLALRAEGLGLGWVSILDQDRLHRDLDVPDSWRFIGYLCIGWPEKEDTVPELERAGWESRAPALHLETR
ncbi:5,6-dimethylbenzimidazole synthase [Tabrizicola sp.]|uniref:5,6-dimethylbenzimidazole synthase n=1 Tax=Tabrizicola sp. TaxID=2005166 RepID=UPI001A4CE12F|nr:5,6-dimethylbenzimidazole synthase [Tabrizicola sp.]MBL9073546.1 5,6-dimethylbenzimidazole synthase [Tabrizicola sp.]